MKLIQHLDCPYFPCHFKEQSCKHCYCPLYPCRDERCGEWITTPNGFLLWDCSKCRIIHTQDVVTFLNLDPLEKNEKTIKQAKEKLRRYIDRLPNNPI